MNSCKNTLKSLAASLLLLTPLTGQAESNVSFLVSLQDAQGNHVCNGSYIGNNQILTHSYCSYGILGEPISPSNTPPNSISLGPIPLSGTNIIASTAPPSGIGLDGLDSGDLFINGVLITAASSVAASELNSSDFLVNGFPITGTSLDVTSDVKNDLIINGVPVDTGNIILDGGLSTGTPGLDFPLASVLGSPVQAVFLLADGNSLPIPLTARVQINQVLRHRHPMNGSDAIFMVDAVPAGVEALLLADEQLTAELLQDTDRIFTLTGRYVDIYSSDVSSQSYVAQDSANCNNTNQSEYQQTLCLAPVDGDVCSTMMAAAGSPMYTLLDDGSKAMVAMQGYSGCGHFPASSRIKGWANSLALKEKGLTLAVAYDMGDRKINARHGLPIKLVNESSDQVFDITNLRLDKGQVFTVRKNRCGTLLPGDACTIRVKANAPQAQLYLDQLKFSSQGNEAGVYLAIGGFEDRHIDGDRRSSWHIEGWTNNGPGGSLYTSAASTRYPSMSRNTPIAGPTKIHVTYRADGDAEVDYNGNVIGSLTVSTHQKTLGASPDYFLAVPFLPATNGAWVTETIEITEPGIHSLYIQRGPTMEEIEISNICIGECN